MSPARESGASRLLDREPPADYLREWTERVAAVKETGEAGTVSVLIFRLSLEWLALPAANFQEVAEHAAFHSLPHRTGFASGLVSIRGEVLVCVSLEAVLGLIRTASSSRRFLVVKRQGESLVFPVDEVAAVHRYHPRELRPLPATLASSRGSLTLGLLPWRERTVGCLDEELLFRAVNQGMA